MITAQMIREALTAQRDGFWIDHKFPSALSEGFPMYHDAPIVGQWATRVGFEVVSTHDGATSGYAETSEGIRLYRGGFVCYADLKA